MKLKVVGSDLGILLELPSHFFPECHKSRVTTSLHGNKRSKALPGRGGVPETVGSFEGHQHG